MAPYGKPELRCGRLIRAGLTVRAYRTAILAGEPHQWCSERSCNDRLERGPFLIGDQF